MKTHKKIFVGKGKQVMDMNVVCVTIPLDFILKAAECVDGTYYFNFEIAKLKEPLDDRSTHICYYEEFGGVKQNDVIYLGKKAKKKLEKAKANKELLPF